METGAKKFKINEELAKGLKNRDFLSIVDISIEELNYIMDLAAYIKDKTKKGDVVDFNYVSK